MKVNGKIYDFNEITVKDLLKELKLEEGKVVVEVDMKILNKDTFATYMLHGKEEVEIVAFIGGG